MHLDSAVRVAKKELRLETDYRREAENQMTMYEYVKGNTDNLAVPQVIEGLSADQVLTTERVYGVPIEEVSDCHRSLSQLNSS